jgi:hypothetical protein
MPGPLMTALTSVKCTHAGECKPTVPIPDVKINGVSIVTQPTPYTVTACTYPAMTSGNQPPCVTASFTTAATMVKAHGQFVLLTDSQGTSMPNGTPLIVIPDQIQVKAT